MAPTTETEFLFRHSFNYAHDTWMLSIDDAEEYASWIVRVFAPEWGDDDFSHRQAIEQWITETGRES